jgi:mono/diheme cytochrome c family protein
MIILCNVLVSCVLFSFPALGAESAVKEGKKLFENTCADCHRTNGQGLPAAFPALDKNPFVVGDPGKLIDTVLNGRKGKLGQMPSWKENYNDRELAAILTYVRQAWSNKGTPVNTDLVKKRRK